jgi:hypothetical protein
MAFTVSIPDGIRDFEYSEYLRELKKYGINFIDTLRVVDPVTRNRWLAAWEKKSDAEHFARDLRKSSELDHWMVYALPDVEPTRGPLGPIEIGMSRLSTGIVYGLNATNQTLIHQMFPKARIFPNLHITTTVEGDIAKSQERIWDSVALILTGLTPQQIEQLGGYQIVDRNEERVLRTAPAFAD